MLKLSDIRDFAKTCGLFSHYYIGRLDAKQQRTLGAYTRASPTPSRICLGGRQNNKYAVERVSFLVRGDESKSESEQLAWDFYDWLAKSEAAEIGGHDLYFIQVVNDAPIDVDSGSDRICEYVVQADFYYGGNL